MFGLDHRPAVNDVSPQSENLNFSGDGIVERSASSSHHESIDKDIQGMVIVRMNHGKAGGVAASCCAAFDMPHKKAYISHRIHLSQRNGHDECNLEKKILEASYGTFVAYAFDEVFDRGR